MSFAESKDDKCMYRKILLVDEGRTVKSRLVSFGGQSHVYSYIVNIKIFF